jgi:hypothetical protein
LPWILNCFLFIGVFYGFKVSLWKIRISCLEADVIKDILKDADKRMHSAIQNLDDDLAGIRTGRATPALVEKLPIDYYGAPTPLMQLASISVPEPRGLLIKPFDPSTLKGIERIRPGPYSQ